MTPAQLVREAELYLEGQGCSDARIDAWYLYEYVFGTDRTQFMLGREEPFSPDAGEKIETYRLLTERRGRGEPLQYITGEAWFMGLRFAVDPSVLIPRADTEILVETALEQLREGESVLDMCTGSGCIILSLAKLGRPGRTTGADISAAALQTAQKNRELLGLSQTELIQSDLFENITGRYDMIVSNPPYIPSGQIPHLMREVAQHEPVLALDGSQDGLAFYREITRRAGDYLQPGGRLIMEIGMDQGQAVSGLMLEAGFLAVSVRKDLAGLDRVVMGRLPDQQGQAKGSTSTGGKSDV